MPWWTRIFEKVSGIFLAERGGTPPPPLQTKVEEIKCRRRRFLFTQKTFYAYFLRKDSGTRVFSPFLTGLWVKRYLQKKVVCPLPTLCLHMSIKPTSRWAHCMLKHFQNKNVWKSHFFQCCTCPPCWSKKADTVSHGSRSSHVGTHVKSVYRQMLPTLLPRCAATWRGWMHIKS